MKVKWKRINWWGPVTKHCLLGFPRSLVRMLIFNIIELYSVHWEACSCLIVQYIWNFTPIQSTFWKLSSDLFPYQMTIPSWHAVSLHFKVWIPRFGNDSCVGFRVSQFLAANTTVPSQWPHQSSHSNSSAQLRGVIWEQPPLTITTPRELGCKTSLNSNYLQYRELNTSRIWFFV